MDQRWSLLAVLTCLVVVTLALCQPAVAQDAHTLTGEFRTHRNFHSRHLASDRDVLVYLPPGYESGKRRYPVLYLHDGQNLFDGATSFIKGAEWGVDETAQALITAREMEPVIIVGIYNTGKDRIDEYTPTADAKYKMGGKADLYGRLLVEELKPFIDSQYRTLKGAKHTGLGGSSLGGLVSLYLALKYPQTFGRVAITSPSVWWDDKMILREVAAVKRKLRLRVWLDMGTKEGGDEAEAARHTQNARLLRDALIRQGLKEGSDLKYFEATGAEHNERAWAQRVGPMLRFLFPRK